MSTVEGNLVGHTLEPALPYRGAGIGVIAPFDFVLDRELWRWLPDTASLYVTRTHALDGPVGVEFAEEVADHEAAAAASADLAAADPDVTVYACTSGSFVGGIEGEQELRAAMERGGARRAITTSGALLEALRALGAGRVGIATPYDAALSARLRDLLVEAGHEPTALAYLGLGDSIAQVSPDSVADLARAAAGNGADAVFISCTNLPTFDLLPELERELGLPVLSANLVTVWAALRAVGAEPADRPERLFALDH